MGNIDTEFWCNRLEVNSDLIQKQHEDDEFVERWVNGIKMRARAVLAERLGIDPGLNVRNTRKAIYARRDELIDYRMAEAAAAGRTSYAIAEVARAKLPEKAIERCRENDERFDRIALIWLLYANDPKNLELVFHLDRIHRKGFARLVLDTTPPMNGTNTKTFFDSSNLQRILDSYERKRKTFKQSHCAAVLDNGGGYQLFIKRDMKPSFVSRGRENTFGYEREWIVLEFDPNLGRVHICSVTPDAPLLLANHMASIFFGSAVHYENESIITSADKVHEFLHSLLSEPERLPLVEVTVKNSGLDGSPQLRLNEQGNDSLARAINQIGHIFGNPFDSVTDIDCIKVHKFKKRVKIIFEPVGEDSELYVVRYADQPLNGRERREFESMFKEDYKITVLSTEKRYAH